MNCRICGKPMHSFVQPALMSGREDRVLVECHNIDCQMRMQTLSAEHYAAIDLSAYLAPRTVPASAVRVGMKIDYRRTAASAGIYEVLAIASIYGGALAFRCRGASELGAEFETTLVYKPDETVESVEENEGHD